MAPTTSRSLRSLLLLASLFPLAAGAQGPTASPTPRGARSPLPPPTRPVARELLPPAISPTPTSVPLGSLAKRLAAPDRDLAAAPTSTKENEISVYDWSIDGTEEGLVVTGTVRNYGQVEAHPRVIVEGKRLDGSTVTAYATLSPSSSIPPHREAEFFARLPEALRSTVKVRALTGPTTGGEIGSTSGRRLAECLSYRASIPEGPGQWSLFVDVDIRNRCAESVPAERAAFALTVKDVGGVAVGGTRASPSAPVPAGGVVRVTVDLRAPRNGRAEAVNSSVR